jgi:hypothetical protein
MEPWQNTRILEGVGFEIQLKETLEVEDEGRASNGEGYRTERGQGN